MQLFSSPQQIHANNTKKEPNENEKLLISSIDNIMLETVIREIAPHSLFLMDSLNIIKAIIYVATISKLFSKEAFAAEVVVSPIIKNIGATISNATILIV